MQIGLIGLGRMGAGMAERLMARGHTLVGFDLNAGNLRTAAETIARLRSHTGTWGPDAHRVTELESFLEDARREAGNQGAE